MPALFAPGLHKSPQREQFLRAADATHLMNAKRNELFR